ncbi:MAG: hypothetical protein WC777_05670 [Candidatus Gracilibacteria bacterium]|jgi:hypothetical protein
MCTGHRQLEGSVIRVDSRTIPQLSAAVQARYLLHGLYAVEEVVAGYTGPHDLGGWRERALLQVCEVLEVNPPTLNELQARLGTLEIPPADQDYLLKPLKGSK